MQHLSKAKAMTHGPLAMITFPLSIAAREAGEALVTTGGIDSQKAIILTKAGGTGGAVLGFFGFIIFGPIMYPDPTISQCITILGSGLLGGAVIGASVPLIASTVFIPTIKVIKQLPNIIANSWTGLKRSRDFVLGAKPEPIVINPVPDRGVAPLVLPVPRALLKLAGAVTDFKTVAEIEKTASSPKPETPSRQSRHTPIV